MTKFKDVAHLHLGCKCSIIGSENIKTLRSIPFLFGELCAEFGDNTAYDFHEIKPILRPLSSMTGEEDKEMVATQEAIDFKGYKLLVDTGETFAYMLSKGFDLFDLIEAREAIDATTLTKDA
jgi:hypothetical protein